MTPEQINEARTLITNGATYAEVAERFSVTVDAVMGHFSAEGIHRDLRRQKRDIMFQMLQEGKTAREISDAVGLSIAGTRNVLSKMRKYARQK
jgi:hypothetical protein